MESASRRSVLKTVGRTGVATGVFALGSATASAASTRTLTIQNLSGSTDHSYLVRVADSDVTVVQNPSCSTVDLSSTDTVTQIKGDICPDEEIKVEFQGDVNSANLYGKAEISVTDESGTAATWTVSTNDSNQDYSACFDGGSCYNDSVSDGSSDTITSDGALGFFGVNVESGTAVKISR